jgi:hypothetical protein
MTFHPYYQVSTCLAETKINIPRATKRIGLIERPNI